MPHKLGGLVAAGALVVTLELEAREARVAHLLLAMAVVVVAGDQDSLMLDMVAL
jgi:hypothetical protein